MTGRGVNRSEDLRARSHINPLDSNPYDPCWHWSGAKSNGMPRIHTFDHDLGEKRPMSGPRAVWNISKGKGPGSSLPYRDCGSCDCVNPGHHKLAADKAEIGRFLTKSGRCKGIALEQRRANIAKAWKVCGLNLMTAAVVCAIRESSESGVVLAARYGITDTAISRVRLRQTYKHVKESI